MLLSDREAFENRTHRSLNESHVEPLIATADLIFRGENPIEEFPLRRGS